MHVVFSLHHTFIVSCKIPKKIHVYMYHVMMVMYHINGPNCKYDSVVSKMEIKRGLMHA